MPGSPDRVCDLIMKGGVTSGVVYPPAICAIAERFWLNGIGGTSAGAIAAGFAAAAEYRRRTESSHEGFKLLSDVSAKISGKGQLLSLFKPDASTQKIFKDCLDLKKGLSGSWTLRTRAFLKLARYLLFKRNLQPLVDNHMGLCTGMANGRRRLGNELPPLTRWLFEQFNAAANLPLDRPLTFGDLFHARPIPGLASPPQKSINLQLVSTCLTFGRPYVLPYLDKRFAFRAEELRPFFSAEVIKYLVATGEAIARESEKDGGHKLPDGLLPFPSGDAMPVIVAVRMSLSFPFLFAPIPLYYWNLESQDKRYDRVYFADGGITSNLPVHFFDAPFPRWPTLAINLQYGTETNPVGRSNVTDGVWMTTTTSSGTLELFNEVFAGKAPLPKLFSLVSNIFRSAQNWNDRSYLTLPGYRDRMAEVWLNPDEGGLNLEMPASTIDAIKRKGEIAGRRLVERFADAPVHEKLSWEGHRWTRYRMEMAAIADHLQRLARAVSNPQPQDRPLADLLATVNAVPVHQFRAESPLSADDVRKDATILTNELLALAARLTSSVKCDAEHDPQFHPFCHSPRPPVRFQARAAMTPDAT